MLLQLMLVSITGKSGSIYYWENIRFVWQFIYLFITIKTIYETNILKAILSQAGSFVIVILLIFALILIRNTIYQSNFYQGLEHIRTLEFEKAIKNFSDAIKEDPYKAKYHYYLGESYQRYLLEKFENKNRQDIFEKAEYAYKRALELNPRYTEAHFGLGILYFLNGRLENALDHFEAILEIDPKNKKANEEIAKVYLRLDKPYLARKHFQRAFTDKGSKELLERIFKFTEEEKIKLLDGNQIKIKSRITWHVIDPILYKGAIGEIETAEKRIKDLHTVTLMNMLCTKTLEEISSPLNKDMDNQIMSKLNDSILNKNFGIEIVELELNIIREDIDAHLNH